MIDANGNRALVGEYDDRDELIARPPRFRPSSGQPRLVAPRLQYRGRDDPLVWYTSSNLGSKRYLHADRLGSIIAVTQANGSGYARCRKSALRQGLRALQL